MSNQPSHYSLVPRSNGQIGVHDPRSGNVLYTISHQGSLISAQSSGPVGTIITNESGRKVVRTFDLRRGNVTSVIGY